MGAISFLDSIYTLDSLDTRFVNDSRTPYKVHLAAQKDLEAVARRKEELLHKKDKNGWPLASPSKWATPEYIIYTVGVTIALSYMCWLAYDVSKTTHPNYYKLGYYLLPGWVPGRKIDLSDNQYRTFRWNIPYLLLLVIFHPLLRKLYALLRPDPTLLNRSRGYNSFTAAREAEARLEQRASYDFGFGILFLGALHGFSVFKILFILYINFSLTTRMPKKLVTPVTWAFGLGILFANELSDGYQFSNIANHLVPSGLSVIHSFARWLDSWRGIMPRWEINFNITVLRLISFNLDHLWSFDRRSMSPEEKKQLDPADLSEKDRLSISANAQDYSFRNYVAYTLYAPLYLAGPILTFNEYISQHKYTPATISSSRTFKYTIRFLMLLLSMELILHYNYCGAISKSNPVWSDYTPAQVGVLSYFNLHIIWLKLLLPWRFFRLWALVDGIDPPENMIRCVLNNFSVQAFWRSWHRSYNRWLVRYMYIPLGGADTRSWMSLLRTVRNYGIIFTWVALWHDIEMRLLVWGWLIVLFMLPEVACAYAFPRRRWKDNIGAYRVLSGLGAVALIILLIVANTVGFAVGVDGMMSIGKEIFTSWDGYFFLLMTTIVSFMGAQVMFEIREGEQRDGIFLKC